MEKDEGIANYRPAIMIIQCDSHPLWGWSCTYLARRLLELGKIGEDLGAVLISVHVEVGFADDAGGIDEESVAGGKFSDA